VVIHLIAIELTDTTATLLPIPSSLHPFHWPLK
jgi:hypothetical protein